MMIYLCVYLQTWFIGEGGDDEGGVTRELWTLLGHGIIRLCEGEPNTLVFRHDSGRVGVSDISLLVYGKF